MSGPATDNPPWTMFFDGPLYRRYDEFMKSHDFSKVLLSSKLKLANLSDSDDRGTVDKQPDPWDTVLTSPQPPLAPAVNRRNSREEAEVRRYIAEGNRRIRRRTLAYILLGIVAMAVVSVGTALVMHFIIIPDDTNLKTQVNISFSENGSQEIQMSDGVASVVQLSTDTFASGRPADGPTGGLPHGVAGEPVVIGGRKSTVMSSHHGGETANDIDGPLHEHSKPSEGDTLTGMQTLHTSTVYTTQRASVIITLDAETDIGHIENSAAAVDIDNRLDIAASVTETPSEEKYDSLDDDSTDGQQTSHSEPHARDDGISNDDQSNNVSPMIESYSTTDYSTSTDNSRDLTTPFIKPANGVLARPNVPNNTYTERSFITIKTIPPNVKTIESSDVLQEFIDYTTRTTTAKQIINPTTSDAAIPVSTYTGLPAIPTALPTATIIIAAPTHINLLSTISTIMTPLSTVTNATSLPATPAFATDIPNITNTSNALLTIATATTVIPATTTIMSPTTTRTTTTTAPSTASSIYIRTIAAFPITTASVTGLPTTTVSSTALPTTTSSTIALPTSSTTSLPITTASTIVLPTTTVSTTTLPTTAFSTTTLATTTVPTTALPTTTHSTTALPTKTSSTTEFPSTTVSSTVLPATTIFTTEFPSTTVSTTALPATTVSTSALPTTTVPTTALPTTTLSTTAVPTTTSSTTELPSTTVSSTVLPATTIFTTEFSSTTVSTTALPTTTVPTTALPTTTLSTTALPTTTSSTTELPSTTVSSTALPATTISTTALPTTTHSTTVLPATPISTTALQTTTVYTTAISTTSNTTTELPTSRTAIMIVTSSALPATKTTAQLSTTTALPTTTLPDYYNVVKMADVTSYTFEEARIHCDVHVAIDWRWVSLRAADGWPAPIEVRLHRHGAVTWSRTRTRRHDVEYTIVDDLGGLAQNVSVTMVVSNVQCRDRNVYVCTLVANTSTNQARNKLTVVGKPGKKIQLRLGPSVIEDKALRITAIWQGGFPVPWANMSWIATGPGNKMYDLRNYGAFTKYELQVDSAFCQTTMSHSIVIFPPASLNNTALTVRPDLSTTKHFVNEQMKSELMDIEPGVEKILIVPSDYCLGSAERNLAHPYTRCTKFIRCLPGDIVVQPCPFGTCFDDQREECI